MFIKTVIEILFVLKPISCEMQKGCRMQWAPAEPAVWSVSGIRHPAAAGTNAYRTFAVNSPYKKVYFIFYVEYVLLIIYQMIKTKIALIVLKDLHLPSKI